MEKNVRSVFILSYIVLSIRESVLLNFQMKPH